MKSTFLKALLLILFSTVFIHPSESQSKRKRKKINAVISEARTYIGTPYRYGGTSKSGIDCSGLMCNCYQTVNVQLPRTSKDQSKYGRSKNWDTIRPGDIVFFKFKDNGSKWYHSGMITYAEKDDIRFIHASSSRGVVESSLMQDYYKKNVKKFRRVIR